MTTRRPASTPAVEVATPEMAPAQAVTVNRPITGADLDAQLRADFADDSDALKTLTEGLGPKPFETLMGMDINELQAVSHILGQVADSVDRLQAIVDFAARTRAALKPLEEPEAPKVREVFQGEANLDQIRVNVVLTVDPTSGMIRGVQVLNDGEVPAALGKNQLYATITASELVKEHLAANWTDDQDELHRMDGELERTLMEKGWVQVNGGGPKTLSKITPGQIPSSRAWVNPDGALRQKWENSSRKALAAERRVELAARSNS